MKRIISIAVCLFMTAALSQSYAQHRRSSEKGKKQRTEQSSRRHNHHDNSNNHNYSHSQHSPNSPRFDADMFEHRVGRLKQLLDLSDRQYKKVVALGREQIKKAKKFAKHSPANMKKLSARERTALRKQLDKMRSEYDAKMKRILDREQWKKYREFREHRNRH